jgi:hypothetical protein
LAKAGAPCQRAPQGRGYSKSRHALGRGGFLFPKFGTDPASGILFLENLNNVFCVDANGLGLTEKEDHVKILRRTKLTGLIE